MHRRLQFGMRENPASTRRHGSRAVLQESLLATPGGYSYQHGEGLVQSDASQAASDTNIGSATGEEGGTTINSALPREAKRPTPERPLTSEEAAAFVRVHPRTVKRMARAGKVPGHFRFGRWYFYASELDCWMRMELHSARHP